MTLPPVHGHRSVLRALARARLRDALPAALLIHGAVGVGKQRMGLWAARLLLCRAPTEEGPCGECKDCRMALKLEHPDIHWHFPLPRPKGASTPEKLADALEEARHVELGELRADPLRPSWSEDARAHYLAAAQTIRRKARQKPSMASGQVFLIGDAESLVPQASSPEAANALLKLLEEPPPGTRFILTSSEPGRLLPTIRSRCLHLHLSPLPVEEVATFLREHAGASDDDAARAAGLSHGSIGRALGFLPDGDEPGPLERLRREAFELLEAAAGRSGASPYRTALGFQPWGARGLLELFAFVEEWQRDLAAVAAGSRDAVMNRDRLDALEAMARGVDPVAATGTLDAVEEARGQARGNVNPQLIVTGLLAELADALTPDPAATGGRT